MWVRLVYWSGCEQNVAIFSLFLSFSLSLFLFLFTNLSDIFFKRLTTASNNLIVLTGSSEREMGSVEKKSLGEERERGKVRGGKTIVQQQKK